MRSSTRRCHIVGVGLERNSQDRHPLILQYPELFLDLIHQMPALSDVYVAHFLQKLKGITHLLGDLDKSLDILGKTRPPETDAGIQEVSADTFVHADTIGYFLHVSPGFFADSGDGIYEGDLGGQERIGGVLDYLGGGKRGWCVYQWLSKRWI